MALTGAISLASCGSKNKNMNAAYLVNLNNNLSEEKVIINEDGKININIPTISGYSFGGVYTDSNYKDYFDADSNVEKGQKLYIKWNENNVYESMVEEVNLDSYINSLMNNTPSYIPAWNMEGFKGRWNYIDGVFLKSILNAYEDNNNSSYLNFVKNYVNYYISSDGTFNYINNDVVKADNSLGYKSGELDSVCESNILFDLYDYTNDSRYKTAIDYTYSQLISMNLCYGTNNYNHKSNYPNQIWLDGMYMYALFLARYAKMYNDSSIFSTIKGQYEYIYDHMRNSSGVYYHGMDTSNNKIFWANSNTGCSESIWLRSNGWLMVSLVDVIEYFPEGEDKTFLKNMLVEAVDSIIQFRDSNSKMYYQLVDKAGTGFLVDKSYSVGLKNGINISTYLGNYLESSGSSMMAYVMLKGANKGYLLNKYKEYGLETFEGIYQASFKNNVLNNICITAGLGPDGTTYRDGTPAYYLAEKVGSNDAKGVGPFIMAYTEYIK